VGDLHPVANGVLYSRERRQVVDVSWGWVDGFKPFDPASLSFCVRARVQAESLALALGLGGRPRLTPWEKPPGTGHSDSP